MEVCALNSINCFHSNINFKSKLQNNETLQKFMKVASVNDIVDFNTTLNLIENDGRDDIFLLQEIIDDPKELFNYFIRVYRINKEMFGNKEKAFDIIVNSRYNMPPAIVIFQLSKGLRECCRNITYNEKILEKVTSSILNKLV